MQEPRFDLPELTERQQACLRGYIARKTAKEIGRELGISHHAVEQHLKAARKKLNARDSADAARIYFGQANATAEPYYGGAELSPQTLTEPEPRQPERVRSLLRDSATDGTGLIQSLSVRQTLLAIGLCALGGMIILALIVAVANGVADLAP